MSRENVEVVREAFAAYAHRDVAAFRMLNHRDLELDWSASRGWRPGVYRSIESAMAFYTDYFDTWESIALEAESYIPVGDCVVVPYLARHRGRGGMEVTARSTLVFTLCDRKITRICLYEETDEASKP